jgi:hypothetical protein
VGILLTDDERVLFMGMLRGALAVVLGVTGDITSLGAIDFGFLVDGPIVMLERLDGCMFRRWQSPWRVRCWAPSSTRSCSSRPCWR